MNLRCQIVLEMWDGPDTKRERLPEATPQTLRQALSRLDGYRTDSVWVEIEGVGALCVGGGPTGFVVVSFPLDGSSSHVVAHEADGTTVELQVGGQTGLYPNAMVLPAQSALEIAEHFLLSGVYDPNRSWVEDCPPE